MDLDEYTLVQDLPFQKPHILSRVRGQPRPRVGEIIDLNTGRIETSGWYKVIRVVYKLSIEQKTRPETQITPGEISVFVKSMR